MVTLQLLKIFKSPHSMRGVATPPTVCTAASYRAYECVAVYTVCATERTPITCVVHRDVYSSDFLPDHLQPTVNRSRTETRSLLRHDVHNLTIQARKKKLIEARATSLRGGGGCWNVRVYGWR